MGSYISIVNNTQQLWTCNVALVSEDFVIAEYVVAAFSLFAGVFGGSSQLSLQTLGDTFNVLGLPEAVTRPVSPSSVNLQYLATAAEWGGALSSFSLAIGEGVHRDLEAKGFVNIPPGESHQWGKFALSLVMKGTCVHTTILNESAVQLETVALNPIATGATNNSDFHHDIQTWLDQGGSLQTKTVSPKFCPLGTKFAGTTSVGDENIMSCTPLCASGYVLSDTITGGMSVCVATCPTDYHIQDLACVKGVCSRGYTLDGDSCVRDCPDGYDAKGDNCVKICPDGTKAKGDDCIVVDKPMICPDGFQLQDDACVRICAKGATDCGLPTQPNIFCPDGFQLQGEKCVQKCPVGYELQHHACVYPNETVATNDSYAVVDTVCPDGFEKHNDSCVKVCPEGTEEAGDDCVVTDKPNLLCREGVSLVNASVSVSEQAKKQTISVVAAFSYSVVVDDNTIYYPIPCTTLNNSESCSYRPKLSEIITRSSVWDVAISSDYNVSDLVEWHYAVAGDQWSKWGDDIEISFSEAETKVLVEARTPCGQASLNVFIVKLTPHSTHGICASFPSMVSVVQPTQELDSHICSYPGSNFVVLSFNYDNGADMARYTDGQYTDVKCYVAVEGDTIDFVEANGSISLAQSFAVELMDNATATTVTLACDFTFTSLDTESDDTKPCVYTFTLTRCDGVDFTTTSGEDSNSEGGEFLMNYEENKCPLDSCVNKSGPHQLCGGKGLSGGNSSKTTLTTLSSECCSDCIEELVCTAVPGQVGVGEDAVKWCETVDILVAGEEFDLNSRSPTLSIAFIGVISVSATVLILVVAAIKRRDTIRENADSDVYSSLLESDFLESLTNGEQTLATPAPPSTRENGRNGVASVRLRRTSSKSQEFSKLDGVNGSQSASNQEIVSSEPARKQSRRHELFTFENTLTEQAESSVTIATLRDNLTAITAFNQRENALSVSLREQVAQLTKELAKLNEEREAEKLERDTFNTPPEEKPILEIKERFLPDINASATIATSTAMLQQHAQMEVSYQRKVLSLENRCLHMTENNKKLLAKIQQFETAQAKVNSQLQMLQQDHSQLLAEADNLKSTISSQTSLIIGLRSTIQKLNKDEKLVDNLRRSLERCQHELEVVKNREKLVKEEFTKFKTTALQEKETLMSKVLSLQQQLQQNDTAGGNVEALNTNVRKIEQEKAALVADLRALQSHCNALQTRVAQLDELSEEFVEVKRTMEQERADAEADLNAKDLELERCRLQVKDTEAQLQDRVARILEMEKLNDRLQEFSRVIDVRDEEIGTLMQKAIQLESELEDQTSRNLELLDENHKLNVELQNVKQLSHDETVQALQMARQKAGNYEALTLLNEEKYGLEEQLRLLQQRIDADQIVLREEIDAKEQLLASQNANNLAVDELRRENEEMKRKEEELQQEIVALREELNQLQTAKPDLPEVEQASEAPEVTEVDTQTDEEHVSVQVLVETEVKLETLRDQFDDFKHTQTEVEVGLKRLVSREKYKAESFQSQLKLLQNENAELSEKVENLFKELTKELELTDAQTLELADLKTRVLSRESIYLLRKAQDSLEQTVTALVESEQSSESTFTCLQCMQLFASPMTLAPCGHTYCAACLAKIGSVEIPSSVHCTMCTTIKLPTECVFPNHALADLTARFVFRQQSLSSLTSVCLSLRNSFSNRSTEEVAVDHRKSSH